MRERGSATWWFGPKHGVNATILESNWTIASSGHLEVTAGASRPSEILSLVLNQMAILVPAASLWSPTTHCSFWPLTLDIDETFSSTQLPLSGCFPCLDHSLGTLEKPSRWAAADQPPSPPSQSLQSTFLFIPNSSKLSPPRLHVWTCLAAPTWIAS